MKALVDVAWENLELAIRMIEATGPSVHNSGDERLISISYLLSNCVADLACALQTIRPGFVRAAQITARAALENLAVAIVLHNDKAKFSDFQNDQLDPNKCIGPAKKIFREIGEAYGLLSNHFVHEKSASLARSTRADGNRLRFLVLPSLDKTETRAIAYALLAVIHLLNLTAAVGELIFARHLTSYEHWIIRNGDELEQKIPDCMRELLRELGDGLVERIAANVD
ncbi:MAG: hypothetical protein R3B45_07715 [Bdellovibrionota bacterium]